MIFASVIAASLHLGLLDPQTVDGLGRGDAARIEAVLDSTTVEWSAAFAERGGSYGPPRLVLLRPPRGHPAGGAGYSRTVGLVVDLGDIDAVLDAFPADGPSLVALMIAHEVGHHVQAVLGDDPEVTGPARERQADCLAGWWIARAEVRATANAEAFSWPRPDLITRLAPTLDLLDERRSHGADDSAENPATHGSVEARVRAFEDGMNASAPWACLWGLNP